MDDLISRAKAVKAALKVYHCAAANRDECFGTEEPFGSLAWFSAAETAKEIVQHLMELPAVDAEMVVRCSNCVFSSRVPQQPRWLFCTIYRLPVPPEFYCGQGHVRGGDGPAAE